MKKFFLMGLGLLFIAGCTPSKDQLKKMVEDNPEIVFGAIEKNPKKFLEVVNKAASKAREEEESIAAADEGKARDAEFANPKVPVINENRAFVGKKDAKVTIVEYSDFQCPFCRRGSANMDEVAKAYPDQVRIFFKNLPLTDIHPQAMIASQYFEAIALQSGEKANKFKQLVFEEQGKLKDGEKFLKELAKKVGADVAKAAKDAKSPEVAKTIKEDTDEARKFEFNGTPGYLVNGVSVRGAYPVEEFKKIIDRHLAKK